MRLISFALILLVAPACAQQAQPFAPVDRELWETMQQALSEIPASAKAHQQINNILAAIQREAQAREKAAKETTGQPPK